MIATRRRALFAPARWGRTVIIDTVSVSAPVQSSRSLKRFFKPGGALAAAHPAYESRPGQFTMAAAVQETLAERRKLIAEAGTGTGKTLAYLVPALLSEKRVVISTGTKALQEQLYFRDVPFLEKAIGRPLRVCYMKGRSKLRLPPEDLRSRRFTWC